MKVTKRITDQREVIPLGEKSFPPQHPILIQQRQIKWVRIIVKSNNIYPINNPFKWII